jgi:transcriptional regulator with XRE-family HTH domain
MNLMDLRRELKLSQEEFARHVGLSSKGYVSQLERGEITPSVKTALEIERLSGGRIRASELNADVALVEQARGE